jgi:hypothetical protein
MNFAKLKGKANIFREYYQRKVAEGKNKMAVINALRNKLVHTIFALVNNPVAKTSLICLFCIHFNQAECMLSSTFMVTLYIIIFNKFQVQNFNAKNAKFFAKVAKVYM